MDDYREEQKIKTIEQARLHISNMPSFAEDFFTYMSSIKSCSPRTLLNYAYDMDTFFFYLCTVKNIESEKEITPDMLDGLSALDIQRYVDFLSSYTKNGRIYTNESRGKARKLACLRSFYKYNQNIKVLNNNPTVLITASKKVQKKNIIRLESDEIAKVMNGVKSGQSLTESQQKYALRSQLRDTAIITLLLGTGIRVSECVGLNLSDIDWEHNSLRVIRKGGDEELVFFNNDVAHSLHEYIDYERNPSNSDENALFISRKDCRLTARSIERLVKKYTQSVVPNKKITPHKLRSTYGTNLYRESGDIYLTADALGHKNIAVTAEHYADIGNERRKTASDYTDKWI